MKPRCNNLRATIWRPMVLVWPHRIVVRAGGLLAAGLVMVSFGAALAQAPSPATDSSATTESAEEPSLLTYIATLLSGGSRSGYISALTLGEQPAEAVRHFCRYDRSSDATVTLRMPAGA